jgi:hypothetical protein
MEYNWWQHIRNKIDDMSTQEKKELLGMIKRWKRQYLIIKHPNDADNSQLHGDTQPAPYKAEP